MPSVVASIPEEIEELIEWLVESGRFESKSEAAKHLIINGAHNKYEYKL